jgi:Mrp family chromosome partitioning ATPase
VLLLAHIGARAILLDCDLRNRSLSAELGPTAAFGVLDVVAGVVPLFAITWTDQRRPGAVSGADWPACY